MSYDPRTDFFALLRQTVSGVALTRAPGLDIVVDALARANLFKLSVGQTAPTVNQATTVWLQPAQPSWSAEGTVWLWDADAEEYVTATPELWSAVLTLGSAAPPTAAATMVFETVTQAQAASIPAPQVSFLVIRYAVGYEAVTATYTPGAPGGPNAFQDASGRWWQLDLTPTVHYASWYGVNGDGGDYHAQLQSAFNFSNGIGIQLPAGVIGYTQPLNYTTTVQGARGLRLMGAGGAGQTIMDNRCTGGPTGSILAYGSPFAFAYAGLLKGINFITSTASPVPFVDILAQYRFVTEDCQFLGSTNGFSITCNLGDADASNQVSFRRCSWVGQSSLGLVNNNAPTVVQTSFVRLDDCFFNGCGLAGWYCIGLSHSMYNCAFTECGNAVGGQGGLWMVNNGAGNASFTAVGCSWENNYKRAVRLDALAGGSFINCEIAGGTPGIVSASGFDLSGTSKVHFDSTRVRIGAALNPYVAFNFAAGSTDNTVTDTTWNSFDATGQIRWQQDGPSYGNRFSDGFDAVQEGADNGVMSIACAVGANQNVALPLEGVIYSIALTGSGAFNIGGITSGAPGRKLTLYNGTGQTLTINHEDAGSTAANRIRHGGGTNVTVADLGTVHLEYYSPISRWLVV